MAINLSFQSNDIIPSCPEYVPSVVQSRTIFRVTISGGRKKSHLIFNKGQTRKGFCSITKTLGNSALAKLFHGR